VLLTTSPPDESLTRRNLDTSMPKMPDNKTVTPRSHLGVLLFCFFLSGSAGLIYQVAWTKALGLVFGHTVYAIATVLAAFMAGLAAGSAFLGRWGARRGWPIALYGWIELLIAITGAVSLLGIEIVRSLYLSAFHAVSGSAPFLVALRFFASMIVLFIPTFLMGGTLPILTGGLSRTSAELGARLSRLYWVNTTGAVLGALAAGFLLLPAIGLRATVLLAAALNVIAGVTALRVSGPAAAQSVVEREEKPRDPSSFAIPRFLFFGFALVGATAMAYEIAWSRLLATTLGSSTYAFTVMLATFLAGIAIGSRLFEFWVSRGHQATLKTFTTTQTFTGLAAILFLVLFQKLPAILWDLIMATHKTFGGLVVAQFAVCALAMLPAAIVFGFNFPVVTLLFAQSQKPQGSSSEAVGRASAANTVGAIVGALAAGFWLVPQIGSFRLVAVTAAINLILAAYLASRHVPRQLPELAVNIVLAVMVGVAGWFGVLYDPATANFSVITNRGLYPAALKLDEVVRMTDLLFSEDGLNASIAVSQSEDNLTLRTNGKVDASTGDRVTQLMLGHLGMVFHPAPRKVLIIGFGSGMTVSAVARYPEVQEIDCIEIEPAVLHAANFLAPLNRGVLRDPRLHMIVDDARNFLFTTQEKYDLIISEPSNPWIAGIASLFTQEFYRQVHEHLAQGGLLVQWAQTYSIFPEDWKMVMGTLAHEFPAVSVWAGNYGDDMLLAQSQAGPLSLDRLRQLWLDASLREDYQGIGMVRPEGLIALHLLDDADLRKLTAGASTNTDDLTRLEYRAPRAIFAGITAGENRQILAQQRSTVLPASIPLSDPQYALAAGTETLLTLQDQPRAGLFLDALEKYPPSAETYLLRGRWLLAGGKYDAARRAFNSARELDPKSLDAELGLAEVAQVHHDFANAESLLLDCLARNPNSISVLGSLAILERSRLHWIEAVAWQTKRIAADPSPPVEAWELLGDLTFREGDYTSTAKTYVDVLNRDPYFIYAHWVLGEILRRAQRWEEARAQLEVAIRYAPTRDADQYLSLADVYRNLGRPGDAQRTLDKGLRLFPGNPDLFHAGAE
jgi:spermidine synthase